MTEEFAEYEVETATSWLSGFWGQGLNYVLGLIKDAWVEAARDAVKVRFIDTAPVDALGYLLRDFNLPGAYAELEATTRARLRAAWESWSKSGSKAGMLAAFAAAGYPNVVIHERAGRWFEFAVVLKPPYPFDPAIVGYSKWGAGWLWDGGYRWAGVAPVVERLRVLAIINHWKPAFTQLLYVVVGVDGPYWGDFTFGDGTVYGGTAEFWS